MDQKAFFSLSYGLYLLSTCYEGKACGCVVNTVAQVTSAPAQLSVAVNKDNYTEQMIEKSGVFTAVVLTEAADMNLIAAFGFQSSKDADKFANFPTAIDQNGVKYVTEHVAARFTCRVVEHLDVGTHVIFIGQVEDAQVLDTSVPVMTYSYYHQVKKGTTPKNAPSYQAEKPKKVGWQCPICGYIYEGEILPEGFVCPICGQPGSVFVKVKQ